MLKKPIAFFRKIIGSDNSFTLIENNFRLLRVRALFHKPVDFCEILALNYAPGAAAPGTAAPGA